MAYPLPWGERDMIVTGGENVYGLPSPLGGEG